MRPFGDEALLDDDSEAGADEIHLTLDSHFRPADDGASLNQLSQQVAALIDTVTRTGGEVSRLRMEVDSLSEKNNDLKLSFERLKSVIQERGHLDMDDFELALDVFAAEAAANQPNPKKGIAH